MLSINVPTDIENRFKNIVQESYRGNFQIAFMSLLKLHEKYAWKEQFVEDVKSIRAEVHRNGGANAKTIDVAIHKYRNCLGD